MKLTKDKILKANDIKLHKLRVEEWDGDVYIKELSLRDRLDIESDEGKQLDSSEIFCRVLIKGLCGDDGEPFFSEEDKPLLLSKNNKVLHKLFSACIKLNKIDVDSVEASEKN